ncbi:MAG TPA: hypothetical protein DEP45_04930 [Armatimonadetes bacterium]|nr:hypothetical protein [Armatimonadota bacterium]
MADPLDVLSDTERAQARRGAQPEWMRTMLAKLTHDHFSSPDWIHERKLDGERVPPVLHRSAQRQGREGSPQGGVGRCASAGARSSCRTLRRSSSPRRASPRAMSSATTPRSPRSCSPT